MVNLNPTIYMVILDLDSRKDTMGRDDFERNEIRADNGDLVKIAGVFTSQSDDERLNIQGSEQVLNAQYETAIATLGDHAKLLDVGLESAEEGLRTVYKKCMINVTGVEVVLARPSSRYVDLSLSPSARIESISLLPYTEPQEYFQKLAERQPISPLTRFFSSAKSVVFTRAYKMHEQAQQEAAYKMATIIADKAGLVGLTGPDEVFFSKPQNFSNISREGSVVSYKVKVNGDYRGYAFGAKMRFASRADARKACDSLRTIVDNFRAAPT